MAHEPNAAAMGALPVAAAEMLDRAGRGALRAAGVLLTTCAIGTLCDDARAESTIRRPGARTAYSVELEPHLVLGSFDPPGPGAATGLGAGLRSTIELSPRGFISKLNDSVGIGLGLDWVRYDHAVRGRCTRFEAGPNDTRICTEVDGGTRGQHYLIAPVVMQWNFWLARRWSVFGEPGMFFSFHPDDFDVSLLSLSVGGRWHFSETATLTLRIGYPTQSLGVSFLL